MLRNKYISYNKSLEDLSLVSLDIIRDKLCKDFALKSLHKSTLPFEYNTKLHTMTMRHTKPIRVTNCHTERLNKSSWGWVVYIQIIRWSRSLCMIIEANDVIRNFLIFVKYVWNLDILHREQKNTFALFACVLRFYVFA